MRKTKQVYSAKDTLEFSAYIEALFSEGAPKNAESVKRMATLVEIVGFESMVKICIALGGTTVDIPKLSDIAKNIRLVRAAQLFVEGTVSKKEMTVKWGVNKVQLVNMAKKIAALKRDRKETYAAYEKAELEIILNKLFLERDTALEQSQNRFKIPDIANDGPENEEGSDEEEESREERTYNHPEDRD